MSDLEEIEIDINEDNGTIGDLFAEKFLIFTILGKYYSFPSRIIGEIALFDTVYPLPLLPPYLPGVVNRYSIPYALFDIGLFLYKTPSPRNKVLIFKDEVDHIAIIIDDVCGIADIRTEDIFIMDRGTDSSELTDTVSACFKWNNTDVHVLDVRRILGRVTGETI